MKSANASKELYRQLRAMPWEQLWKNEVARFDRFDGDNDPHREHDFGLLELVGRRFFWKIDYYDKAMEIGRAHV